ncbi:histidine utilization repressor [Cupriavidus sp. 30B13]|uniref:histidine utilization repressor n=1 Tax=Cupriavidus sp. 30B13 TaxID=3384241 RepID=UPI003B91122B
MSYLPPAAAYAHIKNYLKEGLSSGRWPPGTLMPSESELVTQFGVSRMTANRAVRELQAEGLVERVQGVGTFATQPYRASSTLTIRDLHDEITERGHKHRSDVHLARAETVSEALAPRLGLPAGSEVFHTLIVHSENGVPLLCEDRYVNPARAPDYLSVDFTKTTPTSYLLTVAPLWEAQYSIEAQLPTAEEAQLLGIKPGEPCLIVVRRTESQGSPITLARLVHPGSRYTIEGSFKP